MTSELLLDVRSLWRIPPPFSKRQHSNLPNAGEGDSALSDRDTRSTELSKVLGISTPNVIDMSPSHFWHTLRAISGDDDIVIAVIGDLLRDKPEEKSLPWYTSLYISLR